MLRLTRRVKHHTSQYRNPLRNPLRIQYRTLYRPPYRYKAPIVTSVIAVPVIVGVEILVTRVLIVGLAMLYNFYL